MKQLKIFFLVFTFVPLSCFSLYAASNSVKNLGFERGDFQGWTGHTWIYRTDDPWESTEKQEGIVVDRHSIMSNQRAYDANTGDNLKIIPEGYTYSAKLGSERKGGRHQSLSYTLTIDSTNALLVWKFAVVLLNPSKNHEKYEEPRFKITLYDEKGDTIPDCSNYDVYSTDARIGGFESYRPPGSKEVVVWRDWTTVGANLMPYYGKTVTIEFMSADCTHKGHYGYAYFVLDCMPLSIVVDYCTGDSNATLSAPSGFKTYSWRNEAGVKVDTNQDLLIADPQEGETYVCDMESETGCSVSLASVVERYEQDADFSSEMVDCFSNIVQFSNLSNHTKGSLTYLWDFGDGNTSEEKEPVYKFETSGTHWVSLIIYNPPSGCTDTLYKEVESFSPPLVGFQGDTTYCPGYSTQLLAHGAYRYEWSSGESSDSITFEAPGGNYWFLGHSSTGCISDTLHFTINEEADWPFEIRGDSFLCHGSDGTLAIEGGMNYLWSSGETSQSIAINHAGSYSVSGENKRGCNKELSISVFDVPLPKINFSISTNEIDIRNNVVECKATSPDAEYFKWDMGDGTTSTGPVYTHYYTIPTELIVYQVDVSCVNKYGCSATKSATIAVEPFVPNVFTPNDDGTNDLFMPGFTLKVLDRHGVILYAGEDGWDGIYKGKQADNDTYFYRLNYIDAYKEPQEKKGFITLVR